MNLEERYKQVAETISGRPSPDPTLVEIVKILVTEDQIDLILAFKEQRSQTLDQLKANSGLPEEFIIKQTGALAKRGVIFNQPNSAGVMVFRLLPLVNVGLFEYNFMKKLTYSEEERRLGALFSKLFSVWLDNFHFSPEFF